MGIEKIITIILALACLSCNNKLQKSSTSETADAHLIRDSLNNLYNEHSIKVLADGQILNGVQQIQEYSFLNSESVVAVYSDTLILANKARAIEYEISESVLENGARNKNLIIWQTKDTQRQRAFEFTTRIDNPNEILSELARRRALWISLCNQNDAEALIQELYSENTIYYNHKPLVQGRIPLAKEYQYMNNEAYELSLQPMIVAPVNKDYVFEIGQCAGSYGGKYILIWRKDLDGQWRIFIDSNI